MGAGSGARRAGPPVSGWAVGLGSGLPSNGAPATWSEGPDSPLGRVSPRVSGEQSARCPALPRPLRLASCWARLRGPSVGGERGLLWLVLDRPGGERFCPLRNRPGRTHPACGPPRWARWSCCWPRQTTAGPNSSGTARRTGPFPGAGRPSAVLVLRLAAGGGASTASLRCCFCSSVSRAAAQPRRLTACGDPDSGHPCWSLALGRPRGLWTQS